MVKCQEWCVLYYVFFYVNGLKYLHYLQIQQKQKRKLSHFGLKQKVEHKNKLKINFY